MRTTRPIYESLPHLLMIARSPGLQRSAVRCSLSLGISTLSSWQNTVYMYSNRQVRSSLDGSASVTENNREHEHHP